MKYCTKCGKELVDEAVFCPGCGCSVDYNMNSAKPQEEDKISVGLCILAVFIPLFGLIYWAIKRQETPKRANAVGLCALIAWGINLIATIISAIAFGSIFAGILSSGVFY